MYRGLRGGYRWRLVASNGRKIANGGQGYARREDLEHGVALALGGRFHPDGASLFVRWRTEARATSDVVGVESIPVIDKTRSTK